MNTLARSKREWLIDFFFAFAAGAAIWALSPVIAGTLEPWDSADPLYYHVNLVVAGLVLGFARPRGIWMVYPGVLLGQLIYILLFLPLGPLVVLGAAFLMVFTLLAPAGAAVAVVTRHLIGKYRAR